LQNYFAPLIGIAVLFTSPAAVANGSYKDDYAAPYYPHYHSGTRTKFKYPPTYMKNGYSYFYYGDGTRDRPAEAVKDPQDPNTHIDKYVYPGSRYFRFRLLP